MKAVRAAYAALLVLAASEPALGQGGCLRPYPPAGGAPPEDPEMRDLLNEDYTLYVLDMEDYLNCLQDEIAWLREEFDDATAETTDVIQRWEAELGPDAGIRSAAPSFTSPGSE